MQCLPRAKPIFECLWIVSDCDAEFQPRRPGPLPAPTAESRYCKARGYCYVKFRQEWFRGLPKSSPRRASSSFL